MPADPPLTLSEAEGRGLERIRLVCPKCGRRGTMPSAGYANALAATLV
jgi:hypothetical protein